MHAGSHIPPLDLGKGGWLGGAGVGMEHVWMGGWLDWGWGGGVNKIQPESCY